MKYKKINQDIFQYRGEKKINVKYLTTTKENKRHKKYTNKL